MKPPFIVDDSGDLSIFETLEEAERFLSRTTSNLASVSRTTARVAVSKGLTSQSGFDIASGSASGRSANSCAGAATGSAPGCSRKAGNERNPRAACEFAAE